MNKYYKHQHPNKTKIPQKNSGIFHLIKTHPSPKSLNKNTQKRRKNLAKKKQI